MATFKCGILLALALVVCVSAQKKSSDWPEYYDDGLVRYKDTCEMMGEDLFSVASTRGGCSTLCINYAQCNSFTFHEGQCTLRSINSLGVFERKEYERNLCGFLPSRLPKL